MTHDADSELLASIGEHYVVDHVIGRGGMATVYLCRDTRDDSRTAVKVLRKELVNAIIVKRFLREIAFVSRLDHPRIPKVVGSGAIGDLPYYAMTYVEGDSLKNVLHREKQLPLADAIRITCEVIAPTEYAHSRGIVHRDIKPDNILMAAEGAYVLDFGIARAIIESAVDRLTFTGVGVGTPAYMSPEQALGDRSLDARSDIYSFGCVVYEMIAGIPPFVGQTSQVIISRRFAASPPPLRSVRDGVPEDVEDAVQRALARTPEDRWPSAAAFGKALEAC
ncbi:MAG TPA: serine/threonine-protein kinase [Gemmatimonadaceae bacterium]|nr:serine/threonine-protein kinase [Gemmatimonadaceae bacterium]